VRHLQAAGVDIGYEEVQAVAAEQGTRILGRPHIGQVLIDKGEVKDMTEAFRKYLGRGGLAYERRDRLHPREAIDAIHHAGGLVSLAHPCQLGMREMTGELGRRRLTAMLGQLAELGLDAIEVWHSDHQPAHVALYDELAEHFGLLRTGGSDYHGTRKPIAIGSQRVSMLAHDQLKQAHALADR